MQKPCGCLDSLISSSLRLERALVSDLLQNARNPVYHGAEDCSHYPRGSGSYGSPTAFGGIVQRGRLLGRPPKLP